MADSGYLLEPGMSVLITGKDNIRIKAKIVNMGDYLSLKYSPDSKGVFPLQKDDIVTCYYNIQGTTYVFESIYLGFPEPGKDYIGLKKPILQTQQKRNFVRLGKCLQLRISRDGENYYNGESINVSGGGIKLITGYPGARIGDEMRINIPQINFCASAEVVWVSSAANGQICLGLSFIAIQENERDKIIKYIFNEQARLGK